MKLSAIICTHNRAALLARALESLCRQTVDPSEYEIIVVDNNSKDDTPEIVRTLKNRFPNHPIRLLFEDKQGLSYARNMGYQQASGDYVAYLDDDAIAPANWIEVAQKIATTMTPEVYGGPIVAYFDQPNPAWFKLQYCTSWRSHTSRNLAPDEYIIGCNMVWKRKVLESLGGFDPLLGMSGDKLGYSEETALQILLRTTVPDARLYYCPDLYVHHVVRPEKWRWNWLIRDRFIHGRSDYYAQSIERIIRRNLIENTAAILWRTADLLTDCLYAFVFRDRYRYPFWQNYMYEHALSHFWMYGLYFEHLYWLLSAQSRRHR